MHEALLFLHILAATIWTGGHVVLATIVLPRVLKAADPEMLLAFEGRFERIGIPALLVQVATGIWMAVDLVPDVRLWFRPAEADPIAHLVLAKLVLLLATAALALDAKLRVLPRLTADRLNDMALHIAAVTLLSIAFVFVGVSFRSGGLLW